MFQMTGNIKVDKFKDFKCHSAEWDSSLDNICNTARFSLPALCVLKNANKYPDGTEINSPVRTGLFFTPGMKVSMSFGYNGANILRFKGFVTRVNNAVPVQVDCEGYSYQLRKKIINASYKNEKLKTILIDIIKGTDIKLSNKIVDVTVDKVVFDNKSGVQALEWFKENMFLTVYFNYEELYVGLDAIEIKPLVEHRLNWNVIQDGQLLYNTDKIGTRVNITLASRNKDGTFEKVGTKKHDIDEKILKIFGVSAHSPFAKQVMEEQNKKVNYVGYQGSIVTFLEPYAEPAMKTIITDAKYPQRTGIYFINSVSGSFGPEGGRQVIGIAYKLGSKEIVQLGENLSHQISVEKIKKYILLINSLIAAGIIK